MKVLQLQGDRAKDFYDILQDGIVNSPVVGMYLHNREIMVFAHDGELTQEHYFDSAERADDFRRGFVETLSEPLPFSYKNRLPNLDLFENITAKAALKGLEEMNPDTRFRIILFEDDLSRTEAIEVLKNHKGKLHWGVSGVAIHIWKRK